MLTSNLRREALNGLLIGIAIGDALGFPREGLKPRSSIQIYGRPPLKYQLFPGFGIYSDDTQLALLAAQSILCSRSQWQGFRRAFLRRLALYPLTQPVGIGRATLIAALKSWLAWAKVPTACHSAGNGPATRAMLLSIVLIGTDHRTKKWVEDSTLLTHCDPRAVDGCQVLAKLALIAAETEFEKLNPIEVLEEAVQVATEPELKDALNQLKPFLESAQRPRLVAKHFGWQDGISGFIVPTTVMATYCWLRYSNHFKKSIETAIMLGGDSDSVAAIVGGLAGAYHGVSNIPRELQKPIGLISHRAKWITQLSDRLTQWPHGTDDLVAASSHAPNPLGLVLSNLATTGLVLVHLVIRLFYLIRNQLAKSMKAKPAKNLPTDNYNHSAS